MDVYHIIIKFAAWRRESVLLRQGHETKVGRHSKTATRVKKGYSSDIGVLGHHMGKEEAEGLGTATEQKKEKQGRDVRVEKGKIERRLGKEGKKQRDGRQGERRKGGDKRKITIYYKIG